MKIKKILIFCIILIATFFINLPLLTSHVLECGIKRYPCASESYDSPGIITTHPNVFVPTLCGGYSGGDCTPEGFSNAQLIANIITTFVLYFIIIGVTSKVKNKTTPTT